MDRNKLPKSLRYRRPSDLSDELKQRIQTMFAEYCVEVDFENENLIVTIPVGYDNITTEIPLEAIGKMIGLMNNEGVTVRTK